VDLAGTNTPYGPLMDSLEFELEGKNSKVGTSVVVNRLNPCAFLFYICEHSPRYARLVLEALDRHPSTPSTPWNIIIYEDGVDPGDGLVKEKSRHSVIYYWAFKEFEMLNLCHEELWAAGFIVRTTIAKQYGLPSLTCRLLDSFHNDTNDMLTLGVVAFPEGRKVRIYAKVSTMFADLPALCEMIAAKGPSGNLPCPCCQNASGIQHDKPLHKTNSYCVPITNTDITKFKVHNNQSLANVPRRLQELKLVLKKGELENAETNVYGFSWSREHMFLNSRYRIDACDIIHFDWAHTLLQNGNGDDEFGKFMKAMWASRKTHSCTYSQLGEYVAKWSFPKARGKLLHLFDVEHIKRWHNSGDFSCSSSEFLALQPILSRYLKKVIRPQVANTINEQRVESMIAVLDVIDLCVKCRVPGRVAPTTLMAAIVKHLDLFIQVYGEDAVKPKHHYSLHLPLQLLIFGALLSTLVLERKHRAFKRYARGRTNLRNFEVGVSQEVLCHLVWELTEKHADAYSTSTPTSKQLPWLETMFPMCSNFTLHQEVYRFGYVNRGDMVVLQYVGGLQYGELLLTIGMDLADGTVVMKSIVSIFEVVDVADGVTKCDVKNVASEVNTSDILGAVTYSMAPDRGSCWIVNLS
jgi:hypothetical protein